MQVGRQDDKQSGRQAETQQAGRQAGVNTSPIPCQHTVKYFADDRGGLSISPFTAACARTRAPPRRSRCACHTVGATPCYVSITCGSQFFSHQMLKNDAPAVSAILVLSSRRNLVALVRSVHSVRVNSHINQRPIKSNPEMNPQLLLKFSESAAANAMCFFHKLATRPSLSKAPRAHSDLTSYSQERDENNIDGVLGGGEGVLIRCLP